MALYSKWSLGKNIMFLAGVVMLICIFIPWSNVTDLQSQLVGSLSPIYDGSEVESMVDMMQRANTMSNLRWLMLIPMAYPVYCLFTERYLKNVCCISALVAILYPILAIILGFRYINATAWIFALAAIVFFFGTTMANPKAASLPMPDPSAVPPVNGQAPMPPMQPPVQQPTQPQQGAPVAPQAAADIFCPQCGERNKADARFCAKCGYPLNNQ